MIFRSLRFEEFGVLKSLNVVYDCYLIFLLINLEHLFIFAAGVGMGFVLLYRNLVNGHLCCHRQLGWS